MARLEGTAFITGAGSGIGAAAAHAFAANGITGFSLVDTDPAGLQKVRLEVQKSYPSVDILVLQVDVTDEGSVSNAVKETVVRFSRIDVSINAAGVGDVLLPTHEVSLSAWRKIVETNQMGTWLCERAVVQQMLKQESCGVRRGRGVIVNVASALGIVCSRTSAPFPSYTAAKHAVLGFTKMDAKFYSSHEIRINAICPGWVQTPMNQVGIDSGVLEDEINSAPIGRMAEVQEIADSILFLASPMSSFMYGATLVVDGGYSL